MENQDRYPIQFRFADPRQQRIYEEIQLVGPGPAAFFRDACWLMQNERALESTFHLIAHLLREIESALRSVLRPIATEAPEHNADSRSQKEEIRVILQALGIPEDTPEARAWFELVERLHGFAHRRGLEAPRPPAEVHELWEQAQILLPVVLAGMRDRFLNWFRILDDLLTRPHPTKDDFKRLANEVPRNAVTRGYFFDRLENPEWLEPLRQKGFFQHPPQPIRNEEEDTIRFPPWPEARYLARMAQHKPERVAEIIREMDDTDNANVLGDLVEAMLAMPAKLSAPLVKKAAQWAEQLYRLLPKKLGRLIEHWAKGGQTEEALRVARVLLDVLPGERRMKAASKEDYRLPPEPRARFDTWNYKEILEKYYPELVRAAGLPALEVLCDLLEKTIQLSRPREDDHGPEDYSYVLRPAIEEHPQNLGHTIKDALVSGVRNAAELTVRSRKATMEEVVDALERRRWKVFQRIALHVLRVFADRALPLIATRLTDRNLFDDVGAQHEYILLMRACFSRLTEKDQAKILGWIEAGPDIERFRERWQGNNGSAPSDEEVARYCEVWQRNWLARIGPENLPKDWQERYRTLVEHYGEPEHPEFPRYTEGGWVGPTSPKTAEDIKAMSVEEIVGFLKTWRSPDNVFGKPSPEGLGRMLSSVVSEEPERFASEAARFQGLYPTYVRAFLSGLQESFKHQRTIDWRPVLDLCQWVLAQPREIEGRRVKRMEADPDWSWTRKAIAHLLSAGFDDGAGSIPIHLREKVWHILKPLTNDPDPTPEYEERYGGSNMDPAMLSINTTRGEAMHAVVRYALWVRRHMDSQADAEDQPRRGFDEMPEVREVLDAHLDAAQEPSPAIRAVYGQRFPWLVLLDSKWARDNAKKIFPIGQGEEALLEAAWNTYVTTFCRPYDDVLGILREQYRHAVERIGCRRDDTRWLANPDERLAEHLMEFYWRGKLSLEGPLLMAFWEKAPDGLRGHAIEQALKQTEGDISAEILDRLKQLWELRLAIAKKAQQPSDFEKEMAAFGWWFVSDKFDVSWAIAQLSESLQLVHQTDPEHMVLEHLALTVESHPVESAQCLRILAEGDREGWKLYESSDHIRRILEVALRNPTAGKEAERIIHYLGSRGLLEFRNLLGGERRG